MLVRCYLGRTCRGDLGWLVCAQQGFSRWLSWGWRACFQDDSHGRQALGSSHRGSLLSGIQAAGTQEQVSQDSTVSAGRCCDLPRSHSALLTAYPVHRGGHKGPLGFQGKGHRPHCSTGGESTSPGGKSMRNGRDFCVRLWKMPSAAGHSLCDPISMKVKKRQNELLVTEVRVVLPFGGGSADWEGTRGKLLGAGNGRGLDMRAPFMGAGAHLGSTPVCTLYFG